jgi:hypothetical protein
VLPDATTRPCIAPPVTAGQGMLRPTSTGGSGRVETGAGELPTGSIRGVRWSQRAQFAARLAIAVVRRHSRS